MIMIVGIIIVATILCFGGVVLIVYVYQQKYGKDVTEL